MLAAMNDFGAQQVHDSVVKPMLVRMQVGASWVADFCSSAPRRIALR